MYLNIMKKSKNSFKYIILIENDKESCELSSPSEDVVRAFVSKLEKFLIRTNFNDEVVQIEKLTPKIRFLMSPAPIGAGKPQGCEFYFIRLNFSLFKKTPDEIFLAKRNYCKKGEEKNTLIMQERDPVMGELAALRKITHSCLLKLKTAYEVSDSIIVVFNDPIKWLPICSFLELQGTENGLYKVLYDLISCYHEFHKNNMVIGETKVSELYVIDDFGKLKTPTMKLMNLYNVAKIKSYDDVLQDISHLRKTIHSLLFKKEFLPEDIGSMDMGKLMTSKYIKKESLKIMTLIIDLYNTLSLSDAWDKTVGKIRQASRNLTDFSDIGGLISDMNNNDVSNAGDISAFSVPSFITSKTKEPNRGEDPIMTEKKGNMLVMHPMFSLSDANWEFEYEMDEDAVSDKILQLNKSTPHKKFLENVVQRYQEPQSYSCARILKASKT